MSDVIVLYAFLISLAGESRVIDTDFATPEAAELAALVLQVRLRKGDPDATVSLLRARVKGGR
jgi:hypothetical protein